MGPRLSQSLWDLRPDTRCEGSVRLEPPSFPVFYSCYSYFSLFCPFWFSYPLLFLSFPILCSLFLLPGFLSFTGWMEMSFTFFSSPFVSLLISYHFCIFFFILLFFSVPYLPPPFHLSGKIWILISYFLYYHFLYYLLAYLSSLSFYSFYH